MVTSGSGSGIGGVLSAGRALFELEMGEDGVSCITERVLKKAGVILAENLGEGGDMCVRLGLHGILSPSPRPLEGGHV